MVRPTTEPKASGGDAVDEPPTELLALVCDLIRTGASFGGVGVASIHLKLVDGRPQDFTLPTATAERNLSELADAMLSTLRRMPPGDWTNGAALSMLVDPAGDLDHTGGTFKRAVNELKDCGLIESNQAKGYRVGPSRAK